METINQSEKNAERGSLGNFRKARLILAAALVASTTVPKGVKAQESYQDPIPMVEPLRAYGPYPNKEEMFNNQNPRYSPVCYQLEVGDNISVKLEEEEREFDKSVLDLSNWQMNKMELESINFKEDGYSVTTIAEETDLYSIPLLQSTFIHKKYNDSRPVKKVSVPPSMSFSILQERTLQGENGESIKLGLISNDFKNQQALVLVMSAKDKYGVEEVFVENEEIEDESVLASSMDMTNGLIRKGGDQQFYVNGNTSEQIDLLYSLEDFTFLEEFIKDDQTIQSFINLKNKFLEYDTSTNDLPKFLQTTDWYKEMVEKNGEEVVKEALKIPYIVRISSQPLQCVGFVEMMEELYPELDMVDISSFSTEKGAQSLIPASLYSNYYKEETNVAKLYNGGVGIGGYPIPIEEYKRGDIFVIAGGDFGHVGLVLGKYEVNGQKLLLLADSNKLVDGMVRLYVANENNIDKLLGEQRFILRKSN